MSWGRRKDNNQPYVKTGKKGVKGSKTNAVSDVHMREKTEKEEEQYQNHIERQTANFYESLSDYGHLDVSTAIRVFDDAGLSGRELAEQVKDFSNDTGTPIKEIDVVYIAYEHILQMARNKIDEVLNYDFINDNKEGTEINTAGNYMATSYDYSEEAIEQLRDEINKATKEQKQDLVEDKMVKYFLDQIDIELKVKGRS